MVRHPHNLCFCSEHSWKGTGAGTERLAVKEDDYGWWIFPWSPRTVDAAGRFWTPILCKDSIVCFSLLLKTYNI